VCFYAASFSGEPIEQRIVDGGITWSFVGGLEPSQRLPCLGSHYAIDRAGIEAFERQQDLQSSHTKIGQWAGCECIVEMVKMAIVIVGREVRPVVGAGEGGPVLGL
jgi:hypothetical protein